MGWREKKRSVVSCWPGGARSRAVSPPCEGRPGCLQEEGRGRHHQGVRISACETQRRPRRPSPRLRPTEREGVSAFEAGPSRSFCFTAIENRTVPSARRPRREPRQPLLAPGKPLAASLPRCLAIVLGKNHGTERSARETRGLAVLALPEMRTQSLLPRLRRLCRKEPRCVAARKVTECPPNWHFPPMFLTELIVTYTMRLMH